MIPDRMYQVGLPQSDSAVDNQRVERGPAERVRDGERGGGGKLIALTPDVVLECVRRIKERRGGRLRHRSARTSAGGIGGGPGRLGGDRRGGIGGIGGQDVARWAGLPELLNNCEATKHFR